MSMKLIKDVHGDSNIEIVSSYLLLSEANLGLKRYQSAEEFLSLANWSVLQNPSCSNAVRSQLHRNFGKLYAAQGKHREALDQLSQDVYYSSLLVGPEHVDTACGYFYMADIFYTQSRIESALALYDKVVDVWYKFLASVLNNTSDMDSLGEAQIAEAQEMLRKILSTREKFLGDSHIATGEAKYTLGLLHLFIGETPPAMDNITSAAAIYNEHLGPEHPSTKDVEAVLKQLEESGPNVMRASQQTR